MTEETANKLSQMLMSKDPNEVAATVKILEDFAKRSPGAKQHAAELGATAATTTSMNLPPPAETPEKIEGAQVPKQMLSGPDIEADIAKEQQQ